MHSVCSARHGQGRNLLKVVVGSGHNQCLVYVSQFDASIAFGIVMITSVGFVIALIVSIIVQGVYFITFLSSAVVAEVLQHMILHLPAI